MHGLSISTDAAGGGRHMGEEAEYAAGGRQVLGTKLQFLPEALKNGRKNAPPKNSKRNKPEQELSA